MLCGWALERTLMERAAIDQARNSWAQRIEEFSRMMIFTRKCRVLVSMRLRHVL